MYGSMRGALRADLEALRTASTFKNERVILSPQGTVIEVAGGPPDAGGEHVRAVTNFCANNYLGLANDHRVVEAAHAALERWGFGTSSVRFICGTFAVHKELEERLSEFLGTEDTILFSSAFDANGGFFGPLFGAEDAIVADAFNHASVIDGVRLTKAQRLVYAHSDMDDLQAKLEQAAGARYRVIATDGVFSMDGDIADIKGIVELADTYDALVMVDDSHATGFLGKTGRGSIEYNDVFGKVDLITSTLGKAMGGATGGFTSGRKEMIEILRQKSRPYLFSNTLAPAIAAAGIAAFDLLEKSDDLRQRLMANTQAFRSEMSRLGFDINEGSHPIVPILFRKFENDAQLSQRMARDLYAEGIFVVGFFFPVVPRGQSRIRVQISAAHTAADIEKAVAAFATVGRKHGVI